MPGDRVPQLKGGYLVDRSLVVGAYRRHIAEIDVVQWRAVPLRVLVARPAGVVLVHLLRCPPRRGQVSAAGRANTPGIALSCVIRLCREAATWRNVDSSLISSDPQLLTSLYAALIALRSDRL